MVPAPVANPKPDLPVAPATAVPIAPNTLVVTAVSATQVDLGWTDNANDETGFRVERSSDNFTTVSDSFPLATNIVSFSDTTVTANTTHGSQTESSRGTESEISYYNFYVPSGSSTWYLKVQNSSANEQFYHIYFMLGGSKVKFDSPDPNYTISSPADADSAIAVGAYTTRKVWYDYANNGRQYSSETVDQISTFSSRGPRVDTGAPPKPNIVAPGSAIISARDEDMLPLPSSGPPSTYAPFIDNDGPNRSNAAGGSNDGTGPADYYVMQGTSMACPIAAGVAALILDKNPGWTPAQVRHALESTATDKGITGRDDIYGWGLIDAYDAVNSLLPTLESYKEDYPPGGTQVDLFDDFASENTVYMYSTGLLPSHNYRMVYYEGDNDKRATEDVASDASGNLSTQHTFIDGTDAAGTWNVIVIERDFTPPDPYNSSWEYTIASDTFTVQSSAIPEFPTALAAIVAMALSAGIYLWMRRKAVPVPA